MQFRLPIALLVLLPLASAHELDLAPCLPEGETVDVTFTPDMTWPGFPANGQFVPGSGRGMEDDVFSDDPLGRASDSQNPDGSTTFSIPIENKGGSLSGPNGVSQNGGTEGDCIEVYLKCRVRYVAEVCTSSGSSGEIIIAPGGVGGSVGGSSGSSICYEVWQEMVWVQTHVTEICPCEG